LTLPKLFDVAEIMAAWRRADVNMMSTAVFKQTYSEVMPVIYPSPKYRAFVIKRRDGGSRLIQEPRLAVKELQLKALAFMKQHQDDSKPCVHGFVKGRSILTNAEAHCDRQPTFVLNIDLTDFFPSITFFRVRGALQKAPFGFSHEVSTVLAHLCTLNGTLPQGAPTSPYLANLVCRSLDRDLMRLAQRHQAFYTRYADDITISFSVRKAANLPKSICEFDGGALTLGDELRALIQSHSFAINDKKSRISSRRTRQEVTGLVINEFPNVRRQFVDPVRGALNAWEKHGYLAAQRRWEERIANSVSMPLKQQVWSRQTRIGSPPQLSHYIWGKLLFIKMVRRENDPLYNRLAELYNGLVARDREKVEGFVAPTLPVHFEVESADHAAKALYVIEWWRDVQVPGKSAGETEPVVVQGTAFAYRRNDLLITCEHVLRGELGAAKFDFDDVKADVLVAQNIATGTESPVTILHSDTARDLAVLSLDNPARNMRHFVRGTDLAVATDQVWLLGFPNWTPKRPQSIEHTTISSVFTKGGLKRFEISNMIRKGNSGGPVTTKAFGLLGVAQEGAKQDEGNNACLCVSELDSWLDSLKLADAL
jgi:RNA-directed DNA polymerase